MSEWQVIQGPSAASPGGQAGTEPGERVATGPALIVRVRGWLLRRILRAGLLAYLAGVRVLTALIPRRRVPDHGIRVLVTGRFLSNTWVGAYVRPGANVEGCAGVWVVAALPMTVYPGIHAVYPPGWLTRSLGQAVARILMMAWMTLKLRPHVLGGYHLLFNGLAALWLARLTGARAFYVSMGGPMDCLDGGLHGENAVFRRIVRPDPVIERRLVSAIGRFDAVVTMGTKAAAYYRRLGLPDIFHVIPGAIDTTRFAGRHAEKTADLIFVGRLVEVKRVDVLLEAVRLASDRLPRLSVLILGDGPLRPELERLADTLGVIGRVRFLGQQSDVEQWYPQARAFVLTSDSEGVSLAMLEAMACGLPVVVTDVGDLADMVECGVTGERVPRRDPRAFADALISVLSNPQKWEKMSRAAQAMAQRGSVEAATLRWAGVIRGGSDR